MGRPRIPDDEIYSEACAKYISPADPDPIMFNGVNISNLFRAMETNNEEIARCEKAHRVRLASRKYYANEKNVMKKGAYYLKKRLREGKQVNPATLRKYAEYL